VTGHYDSADGWKGKRPEFGHVRFSKRPQVDFDGKQFANAEHCAKYICKYLSKVPQEGWPEWVKDYDGQIRRYEGSRGLFADAESSGEGEDTGDAGGEASGPDQSFGERDSALGDEGTGECGGDALNVDVERIAKRRTIGERLGRCLAETAVVVQTEVEIDGEWQPVKNRWLAQFAISWESIKERLGNVGETAKKCFVSFHEFCDLKRWAAEQQRALSVVSGHNTPGPDVARLTEFDFWDYEPEARSFEWPF
jgi:hypothetical protein